MAKRKPPHKSVLPPDFMDTILSQAVEMAEQAGSKTELGCISDMCKFIAGVSCTLELIGESEEAYRLCNAATVTLRSMKSWRRG